MSVMLYPCIFCVALLMFLFVLFVASLTMFGETIRNVFGCACFLVAECYGCVSCGWRCSVG